MTVDDVERAVEEIRSLAGDPEAAHSREDTLYEKVLAAIAGGDDVHSAALANAALATQEIKFPRWCA